MEHDSPPLPVVEDSTERTVSEVDERSKNVEKMSTRDSDSLFSSSYVSEMPTGGALTVLPEDIPVQDFDNPSIEITAEDVDPLSQQSYIATTNALSPINGMLNGLSPTMPTSPGARRRRSSVGGHRRRSSVRSLVGLGIAASPELRQRTSVSSNPGDFEDFQDGDGDSDFGDFNDFEEGDFEDSVAEEQAGDSLANEDGSSTNQALRDFPEIQDENSVRIYIRSAVAELLLTENTDHDEGEPPTHENDLHDPAAAESDEEDESPFMLTDRAVSLWKQLTAPPPLQPPDWKRSRIRRLFLVSLGIPVDLDEILPKMTHKKLVLPSTKRHRDKKSADERRSRKKIPPPPEFEITTARQLCATTKEAISAMSVRDLEIHVTTLRAHTAAASGLLTYWLEQREAAQSEKDTFEQVVSNLVQYHKKQKNEQREKTTNAAKKSKSRFSMRG